MLASLEGNFRTSGLHTHVPDLTVEYMVLWSVVIVSRGVEDHDDDLFELKCSQEDGAIYVEINVYLFKKVARTL